MFFYKMFWASTKLISFIPTATLISFVTYWHFGHNILKTIIPIYREESCNGAWDITLIKLGVQLKLFKFMPSSFVATLALGSRPRQGLARLRAKRGSTTLKESVREWTLTFPWELPPWESESRWTLECLKSDCKGQNSMDWRVLYIIEKSLKRRCLKWARITHLDIWNISYGQKKGWESNWQFDSQPLKVRNRPNFLTFGWRATYC